MANIETTTHEELIDGTPVNITRVFQDFNPEREQERDIAVENQKRIFQPKFIPFYPSLLGLDLSLMDILLYGFIDFYIPISDEGRFYFTNAQLSKMLRCSESTISHSLSNLSKNGLIKYKLKMRANGGQIRFVELLVSQAKNNHIVSQEIARLSSRKLLGNKNKINNNKTKENKINNSNSSSLVRKEILFNTLASFEQELEAMIIKGEELYPSKDVRRAAADFLEWCKTSKTSNNTKDYRLRFFKWVREDRFNQYSNENRNIHGGLAII